MKIFDGFVEAESNQGGTWNFPEKRRDRFGILDIGEYRQILINTKYGQLTLPLRWGNKHVEVIIREKPLLTRKDRLDRLKSAVSAP